MPRPCSCDLVPVSAAGFHPTAHCGLCTVWTHHPDSPAARAWRGEPITPATAPTPPARRPLPCVNEGAVLEWCQRCGPSDGRHVRDCDVHDRCTRETVGPGVRGCDRCADYEPPGRMVRVPVPPPLRLRPTRPRAVVTVAAGVEGARLFAASGPHMRRYAEYVGADLVVLDWVGLPEWPLSAKFAVAGVLEHYDRIAYLDADVLCRPGAIDVFDLCEPREFGFVCELAAQRRHLGRSVEEYHHQFRRRMGLPDRRAEGLPFLLNSGVMVAHESHREVMTAPPELWVPDAYPARHFPEQNWVGAALLESGLPWRAIDEDANQQDWIKPGFRGVSARALWHYSGAGGDRENRVRRIKADAAAWPWPVAA